MSAGVFPEIDLSAHADDAACDAYQWLHEAAIQIDEEMGSGYAAQHPALVAGFMKAAAIHYQAERTVDAAEMIARALLELAKERGVHG